MRFFRQMTVTESDNWNRGAILGFYIYMLLLGVNHVSGLLFSSYPFSPSFIFWSGLIVAFGWSFILNFIYRIRSN